MSQSSWQSILREDLPEISKVSEISEVSLADSDRLIGGLRGKRSRSMEKRGGSLVETVTDGVVRGLRRSARPFHMGMILFNSP